ncbi:helix-turn-helix domain-containing protein [Mycobacterium sp. 21AC1]|uniref:PucR family transcriptional regulator n=1 Tax=[Mycobacterium] appelbergii TaxID=2939269 RepID=UPI002938F3BA|nr:helix-turn-helix domain-containing protein [Mycobacterium sp. 21AC1]MDV3123466.1 helix-turn-helix domain-containing protein [Mycobacterium sp. 21AC1]
MVSQPVAHYAPDLDALAKRAATLMWNIYPGYSQDRFDLSELLPSVRANLELAVEVLHRDRGPTVQEMAAARTLGSRRASQSVPLESVIQAYRSTERVILLDLFADSRKWPEQQANRRADLVITTFDLMTDEMINAYRETSSAIEATRRRTENELVNALTSGHPVTTAEFQQWTDTLQIDSDGRWFAFALLGDSHADPLDLHRLRRRLAVQLQPHAGQILFGDVGQATVAITALRSPDADPRRVLGQALSAIAAETAIYCGIGQFSDGLLSAGESCRQSTEAARAAAAGTSNTGATMLSYHEALIEILLSSRPAVADTLVETRLRPLAGYPHLVETIETLLAHDLSQSRVARELFVHVNTVNHRVKRIREITGMDLTRLSDAVELALAVRWQKLTGAPSRQ